MVEGRTKYDILYRVLLSDPIQHLIVKCDATARPLLVIYGRYHRRKINGWSADTLGHLDDVRVGI
jgi:hypothetical protein